MKAADRKRQERETRRIDIRAQRRREREALKNAARMLEGKQ